MTTAGNARQKAGQLLELPLLESEAQNAQRASSVTTALSAVPEGSPAGVSAGDSRSPLRAAAARAQSRVTGLSGTALVHARPASLSQTWARHQEAASHWQAGLVRWPRLAWGGGHVAVAAVVLGVLEVAFSPAGLLVAVALAVALRIWL